MLYMSNQSFCLFILMDIRFFARITWLCGLLRSLSEENEANLKPTRSSQDTAGSTYLLEDIAPVSSLNYGFRYGVKDLEAPSPARLIKVVKVACPETATV